MDNLNMAIFILYYILLVIFTKFSAFKKQRKNMGFRGLFLIGLITTIVFIVNCYNIVYNPTFIFGYNLENRILRLTFLLFFITTFFTIFGLLIADYFRSESDNKDVIQGFKGISGPRGNRGKDKKNSVCDENVCSERICNKKVMQMISDAYTYILKKKGISNVPNGSQIENKFLINKINMLCQSPQFLQLNEEKGESEIYGSPVNIFKDKDGQPEASKMLSEEEVYGKEPQDDSIIRSTWIKWLKIILKYEKGIEFLESEYMVDNDFDNMITENDKLLSKDYEPSPSPGTPSQGKLSPFDEIKKYDMWYWGEKKEAMINVQYYCDKKNMDSEDYKPVLYELDSNQYNNIWRSSIAYQKVDNDEYIPFQNKGSKVISIYRPEIIDTEQGIFKPLGDIVLDGDINTHNTKVNINSVFPKNKIDINFKPNRDGDPIEKTNLIAGDIKSPTDFKKMYASKRSKGVGINKYGYSFWKPVYQNDKDKLEYACPGYVLDNGVTLTPPNKNLFACVPKKCVRPIQSDNLDQSFLWKSLNDDELEDKDQEYPEKNKYISMTKNNKNNLFFLETADTDSDSEQYYELIPKGEDNSCFDNELDNLYEDSKWIVEEKNNPDYSIHSHFNKSV